MLHSLSTSEVVEYRPYNPKDIAPIDKLSLQLHTTLPDVAQPNDSPVSPLPSAGDLNGKKRKRDALGSSTSTKRARQSAGQAAEPRKPSALERTERLSPQPRSPLPQGTSGVRSVDRWEPIERACASTSAVDLTHLVSSYEIVRGNLGSFRAYFLNRRDPYDQGFLPEYLPFVDLEYPMTGITERFPLLSPKDRNSWHPIRELMEAVYTIVKYYLPSEHAMILGDPKSSSSLRLKDALSTRTKPAPSMETPIFDATGRPIKRVHPHVGNLLLRMERAYETKDGVGFISSIKDINHKLRTLKGHSDGNLLLRQPEGWKGVPPELAMQIYEETYLRSAGPRVKDLLKYQAFSSTTYGELNPGLVSEMSHRAGLKPGVNFLDLGSGIGNVVIQTALMSGCSSAGVEKLKMTADIADEVHRVFLQRCRMWGVESGPTDVFQGDFMVHSEKLSTIIKNADVILANNFVFDPALNEGLKALFLDLKDGAKIISLRSFCDGQVTARNMGAIESILDVESFEWHSGDVSWGDAAGRYFISTVNRARVGKHYEALYKEAQGPSRVSRRRK